MGRPAGPARTRVSIVRALRSNERHAAVWENASTIAAGMLRYFPGDAAKVVEAARPAPSAWKGR